MKKYIVGSVFSGYYTPENTITVEAVNAYNAFRQAIHLGFGIQDEFLKVVTEEELKRGPILQSWSKIYP